MPGGPHRGNTGGAGAVITTLHLCIVKRSGISRVSRYASWFSETDSRNGLGKDRIPPVSRRVFRNAAIIAICEGPSRN